MNSESAKENKQKFLPLGIIELFLKKMRKD